MSERNLPSHIKRGMRQGEETDIPQDIPEAHFSLVDEKFKKLEQLDETSRRLSKNKPLSNKQISSLELSPEGELSYREIQALLKTSPEKDDKRADEIVKSIEKEVEHLPVEVVTKRAQEIAEKHAQEIAAKKQEMEVKALETEFFEIWDTQVVPLYEKCKLAKLLRTLEYFNPPIVEDFGYWFDRMIQKNIPSKKLREEIMHKVPRRKSKHYNNFLYPFLYLSHLLKGKPSLTEIRKDYDGTSVLQYLSAEDIKHRVFSLIKSKDDFNQFKKAIEITDSAVGRLLDEQMAKKVHSNG